MHIPAPAKVDFILYAFVHRGSLPKEQGDAPQGGKTHQCVNHPAYRAALSAKDCGDHVKAKDSHTAPVESAYYH